MCFPGISPRPLREVYPDIMKCQVGLVGHGDGFDGELRPPGVESSFEGHRIHAVGSKLLRHTGAGGLIRSGAIGDYRPIASQLAGPLGHLVREHPDAAGDLSAIALVS